MSYIYFCFTDILYQELLTAAFNPAIDYNSPDNKILYQCCGFALLHTESLENLNRDTSFLLLKIEENTGIVVFINQLIF